MHLTLAFDLVLTLILYNSRGADPHIFAPPAGTWAGPQQPSAGTGNCSASVLSAALGHAAQGGGGGGAATSHTHKNQIHMYVSLHMHVHPSLENCFWRALATHTMGSFLQYVLNSCQSSGIWGQNVSTFSYVIPESLISLLDRFSDVQLCFLSTDVQHFCVCLHNISEAWLCRGWKKKKKKASWNKGNITTHFLLPAFVFLSKTPLLKSS